MKIYFDELEQAFVDEMGGKAFTHEGKLYEYRLTIKANDVVLEDAIGRLVPFSHSSVAGLFRAVSIANTFSETLAEAEGILEDLEMDNSIALSA